MGEPKYERTRGTVSKLEYDERRVRSVFLVVFNHFLFSLHGHSHPVTCLDIFAPNGLLHAKFVNFWHSTVFCLLIFFSYLLLDVIDHVLR